MTSAAPLAPRDPESSAPLAPLAPLAPSAPSAPIEGAAWLAQAPRPLRLGVMISGSGRTLLNLLTRQAAGTLAATVVGVISTKPHGSDNRAPFERCAAAGIPIVVLESKSFASAAEFGEAQAQQLDAWHVDLVCLAGYLKLWRIPERYLWRVLNIHPTLLPKYSGKGFFGEHCHQAVLAAHERESGCTVHFADNIFDHGPIVVQAKVPVWPSDSVPTLAARVFLAECEAYPQAVNWVAQGLVRVNLAGVAVIGPLSNFP